ncbi:MAG: 50S ribosomal protein L24 [Neisseriaceae bacterium]
MNKIRKGDQVIVIAGKDRGRQGKVLRLCGDRVVIEGVNVVKRHSKPNPSNNDLGGIVVKNMPLAISNIAILNPRTNRADRVGIKLVGETGSKVHRIRIYKSDGQPIES